MIEVPVVRKMLKHCNPVRRILLIFFPLEGKGLFADLPSGEIRIAKETTAIGAMSDPPSRGYE